MKRNIINFLKRNGFAKMESNHWANEHCGVSYNQDAKAIVIANNLGYHDFMQNDLYTVIGFLTYNGYLLRNYNL